MVADVMPVLNAGSLGSSLQHITCALTPNGVSHIAREQTVTPVFPIPFHIRINDIDCFRGKLDNTLLISLSGDNNGIIYAAFVLLKRNTAKLTNTHTGSCQRHNNSLIAIASRNIQHLADFSPIRNNLDLVFNLYAGQITRWIFCNHISIGKILKKALDGANFSCHRCT